MPTAKRVFKVEVGNLDESWTDDKLVRWLETHIRASLSNAKMGAVVAKVTKAKAKGNEPHAEPRAGSG